MKKLINDPTQVVPESLAGFVAAHSDLVRLNTEPDLVYVTRADNVKPGKVALISGGGSGHEPLHTGYVGKGMLDAAVPGPVFTAPTPDHILGATQAVNAEAGVVYIVKNYTGDLLNFETAAELAQASDIPVQTVVVNDDVAVEDSLYTAGRRGVAGTVIVEKIAGAAAEAGAGLAEVAAIAHEVVDNVRSMGVALSSCTVPHVGIPTFELPHDQVEIGIGIHGEPGRHRIPMTTADEIAGYLLNPIIADLGLVGGEGVVVLVNGMGGTPLSELYIVYGRVRKRMEELGIEVKRSLVGNYTTALDMQGCSITVLRTNQHMLDLWDAPVHTPALNWGNT